MLKKSLMIIVALGVCLGAAALFVTRDTAPTHPALRSADLAPLIPTRAFHADPRSEYGYVISNDGTLMAYTQASLTGRRIVVEEIATGAEIGELPLRIQGLRFHPSKPLVRFIFEGNDWEVDPRAADRQNWKRISPVKLSGGWFKNEFAGADTDRLLTWGKSCNRCDAHMWLVSQDGLEAEKIADGNARSILWMFDVEDRPVLRLDSLDPATQRLMRKTEEGWIVLTDISLNDTFEPLSRVRADGTFFARSSRGRDRVAFVEVNAADASETIVADHPETDIGFTTDLNSDGFPDVLRLSSSSHERIALTPQGETFLNILSEFDQPVSLGETMPTGAGRFVAQTLSPRNGSYLTLMIDLEEQSYKQIGSYHFRRFADALVLDTHVRFAARDGLEIPAILMMPEGTTDPIPFVVYIHGGPAQNVSVGYDHRLQFLVNRGYGVLAVNFRGSTGYGKDFQAAGFKQFGRAMQDDISDAAKWLVSEGLADPDALVAMGASYGGYSAALAMMREPDLFSAGIVEFPMLDVEFQSRYHPGFWDDGLYGWWRYFGELDNDDDLADMRRFSPSNNLDALHGPLLVIAGVKDQITAVQQVRDFEIAARSASKDVDVQYFEDAGHGIRRWRDELRRARLIEDFLAETIGGRSGGFEFVEWAPAFID